MARNKPKPTDVQDLVDVPGGAAMVFVSRKTIWNWLTQGILTRYKVQGRTLVSKRELAALIRKGA
jgi:hypothetical protein